MEGQAFVEADGLLLDGEAGRQPGTLATPRPCRYARKILARHALVLTSLGLLLCSLTATAHAQRAERLDPWAESSRAEEPASQATQPQAATEPALALVPLRHGVPHWVAPEVFDPWGNDDPDERLRAFRPDEHRLTVSAREQARKIRRCFLEVPTEPVYRVTSAARQPADTPVSRCLRAVLSGLTHSRPCTLALRFSAGTLVEVIVVRASAEAPPTRHRREPTRGEVLDPYKLRLK